MHLEPLDFKRHESVACMWACRSAERAPCSSEICLLVVWGINDRLCVGDVVDRGDAPVHDPQLLMDHLDYWAQAVGGTGCSCDNMILLWVILILRNRQLSISHIETSLQTGTERDLSFDKEIVRIDVPALNLEKKLPGLPKCWVLTAVPQLKNAYSMLTIMTFGRYCNWEDKKQRMR